MTTPAYSEFVATNPTGADNGPGVITDILNNFLALRDKLMVGAIAGYEYSQTVGTGSALEPQYFFLKQASAGVNWFRGTPTWTNGAATSILWHWSNDTGATWSTIATIGSTVDTDGNVTATSAAGSLIFSWVNGLRAKIKSLLAAYTAHAASGSAHGIGSIASQSAASVALTGGAINGVAIGQTTPALGTFISAREKHYSGALTWAPGVTLDWSAAGSFAFTTTASAGSVTFSGPPAANVSTSIIVEITNGATPPTITWPAAVKWPGDVVPSLTANGVDLFQFWTRDGGTTVHGFQASKDSR